MWIRSTVFVWKGCNAYRFGGGWAGTYCEKIMHNNKNVTGTKSLVHVHRNQLIFKIVQSYNSHVIKLIEIMIEDNDNSKGQLLNHHRCCPGLPAEYLHQHL